MKKHPPMIEWQIAESDGEWEQWCVSPIAETALHHQHRLQRREYLYTLLLLMVGAAFGRQWSEEHTRRRMEAEVRAVIQ